MNTTPPALSLNDLADARIAACVADCEDLDTETLLRRGLRCCCSSIRNDRQQRGAVSNFMGSVQFEGYRIHCSQTPGHHRGRAQVTDVSIRPSRTA